jgi:hypothetical protein
MATKVITLLASLIGCCLSPLACAEQTPIDPALGCAKNPAVVGKCFPVKGRIGVYNGSPSVRIHPNGSKRQLGVVPSEQEIMPDELKRAIGIDADALAAMQVCPFTKREAGRMQLVCVESAENIRSAKRR